MKCRIFFYDTRLFEFTSLAQLRALVQSNPDALPQILQQIGQSDPEMLRLIRDVSSEKKKTALARPSTPLSASLLHSLFGDTTLSFQHLAYLTLLLFLNASGFQYSIVRNLSSC